MRFGLPRASTLLVVLCAELLLSCQLVTAADGSCADGLTEAPSSSAVESTAASSSSSSSSSSSASGAMAAREAARTAVRKVTRMGFPFQTLDPWLFCVHHRDLYPEGDDNMGVPASTGRRGNGADFDWSQPYRFYHSTGDNPPGFPRHMHRGFETLTATLEGTIDHSDSAGNGGRYGDGDLQWMTAGAGIQHAEMFPLLRKDAPNTNDFFQLWLNLPAKSKMVKPAFVMHWSENIKRFTKDEGKVAGVVWVGELEGLKAEAGPPDSYASQPGSDCAVYHLTLQPGASYEIPAAAGGATTNRVLYNVAGGAFAAGAAAAADSAAEPEDSTDVPSRHLAQVDATLPIRVAVPEDATEPVRILLLQGKPIGENVVQHGPVVMNTRAEVQQAFMDFQRTQFGGWPWEKDGQVFPREKGRFALVEGKEYFPPREGEEGEAVRSSGAGAAASEQ